MKTKEELEQIKEEYAELNKKLAELTENELELVTGGSSHPYCELRYDYRIQQCPYSASYQTVMSKHFECNNCPKRTI